MALTADQERLLEEYLFAQSEGDIHRCVFAAVAFAKAKEDEQAAILKIHAAGRVVELDMEIMNHEAAKVAKEAQKPFYDDIAKAGIAVEVER